MQLYYVETLPISPTLTKIPNLAKLTVPPLLYTFIQPTHLTATVKSQSTWSSTEALLNTAGFHVLPWS